MIYTDPAQPKKIFKGWESLASLSFSFGAEGHLDWQSPRVYILQR